MKNIRKRHTIFTLITISHLFHSHALSQTNLTKLSDLASILDNPIEGREVILQGNIIGQQQGEPDYIFSDGNNQIIIRLENDKFDYNPDHTVEILGIINFESQHAEEIEKDPTPENFEIVVNRLQVIQ